ncbi:MAG: DUF4339 domain-containing protein, partial [Planctomycetota bacterium]|nr:DUF4339 domain-containing protein [Planctomycetota bacterium]
AGPFAPQQLESGVATGEFKKDSLVWSSGMDGWKKASEVPQLAQLFSAAPTPPPVPPQG